MNDLGAYERASSRPKLSIFQFGLFAVVGAAGTLVHYAILLLLVERLGGTALIGSIAGSIGGAFVNFFLNHRVTFRSKQRLFKTAPRFFSIAAISLALNAGLMYLFVERLKVNYLVAQLLATALALCLNYVFNAIWTFGKSSDR